MAKFLKVNKSKLQELIKDPIAAWLVFTSMNGKYGVDLEEINLDVHFSKGQFIKAFDFLKKNHSKFILKGGIELRKDRWLDVDIQETSVFKDFEPKINNGIKEEYKYLFEYDEFRDAWENWCVVRKRKKAGMTPRSDNNALSRLLKLSDKKISVMIQILDNASDGGWTHLFPLNFEVKSSKSDKPQFRKFQD